MSHNKNGYALLIALLLGLVLIVWLAVTQAEVLFPTIKNKKILTPEDQVKSRTTEVQQQAEDYKKQTEENLK